MRVPLIATVALLVTFGTSSAVACSCSNSTPIQKSYARYTDPEHAVFTARIVQLVGKIYNWDGKRESSLALAVVHQRYWGLPWYWPKIVLLDGSYPCDIGMEEGQEYLVAGWKGRYGVLMVNGCSRTQPLKGAQVDLRTLDGTHCSEPGGTIIGHVRGEWDRDKRLYRPMNVHEVTYVDYSGNSYHAKVDADGIYEMRNLPSSLYSPVSRLDDRQYAAGLGIYPVEKGLCQERDISVRNYQLTGRLLPGIGHSVEVEMVNVNAGSKPVRATSVEADGRFYFDDLQPGNYLLSIVPRSGGGELASVLSGSVGPNEG